MKRSLSVIGSIMLLVVLFVGIQAVLTPGGPVQAFLNYPQNPIDEYPRYDFGGQTVVMVKERGMGLPEEGTEYYERWQEVEEYFNVNLELVNVGRHGYDDAIARMMAGDPTDILRLEGRAQDAHIAAGTLMPLNDFLDDSFYEGLNIPEWVKYEFETLQQWMTYRGNIYGVPTYDRNLDPYGAGLNLLWNQSMFKREGLPSLYNLVDDGEWTWDKMLEVVSELTRDTTGDGEIDQFGINRRWSRSRDFYRILVTNNAAITRNIDGRVVFTLDEPAALEVFEFVGEIVQGGYVAPDDVSFVEGNLGLSTGGPGSNLDGMEDDWGVVPYPIGLRTNEFAADPVQTPFHCAIPITTRYRPVQLLTLYYALYPRNPNVVADRLADAELYVRDKETMKMIKMLYDIRGNRELVGTANRHWRGYHTGVSWGDLEQILSGEVEAISFLHEIKPETQAGLDDRYN